MYDDQKKKNKLLNRVHATLTQRNNAYPSELRLVNACPRTTCFYIFSCGKICRQKTEKENVEAEKKKKSLIEQRMGGI